MNTKNTAGKIPFVKTTVTVPLSTEKQNLKINSGLICRFFDLPMINFLKPWNKMPLYPDNFLLFFTQKPLKIHFRAQKRLCCYLLLCNIRFFIPYLPLLKRSPISPPAPMACYLLIRPYRFIKALVPGLLLPQLKITG